MSFMDKAKKLKGTGISLDEASKYLMESEEIIDTVVQLTPHKTKTLVLTSERLLVFTKELLKTTFKDFYFKDIKDIHFSSDLVKQGMITIATDRGNFKGKDETKYLPTDLARGFYIKVQKIEKEWSAKKREMELEDKRAASGASSVVISDNTGRSSNDDSIEAKLEKLKSLKGKGLIDQATYKKKYDQLVDQL